MSVDDTKIVQIGIRMSSRKKMVEKNGWRAIGNRCLSQRIQPKNVKTAATHTHTRVLARIQIGCQLTNLWATKRSENKMNYMLTN